MSKKLIRPYLKHDEDAQGDRELAKIIYRYDYLGYGLYWSIVEFLHKNRELNIGEEYLIRGYDKHPEIINEILNNENLFSKKGDCYVSERILSELDITESKAQQQTDAAKTRWLMSDFKKVYESVFNKSPVLGAEEINNLRKYSNEIPDFKKVLPDIVYTLKFIKFDDDIKMKPLCNWLLSSNNMARVYNGEFGKLRHKKTAKELKAEQDKQAQLQAQLESEDFDLNSFDSKADALCYIAEHFRAKNFNILPPYIKALMQKFDITKKDIEKERGE